MITNNGERKPNSGSSKAAQANKRAQEQGKRRTEAERKKQANAPIATKATSAPKVSQSASTGGTLTTVKQNPSSSSRSSSSSSSSRSSGTSKKALSAAEKSAALNDLMNRATIGSSKTYGLSFQSSVNQKIDSYNQRKQSLVEQATKNGYLVGQNTKRAQDFRNTVNQKLERAISSGKSPSEARADEQQRIRTVSDLNKQIAALDSELAPLKNKIEGRYPVVSGKSGKTKEALTEERNRLIRKKKDITGDYGVLGSIYNSLEAGAGQFNSDVTSTLNAGKNVLMQLEAMANGGWDKETGEFVKGDSPFFGSLLQPVSDLNQSTKGATAQFAQKAAAGWNQFGKGGDVANQLIQGTISAVPNAVLAMATAGGSTAATLSPEASGLTATVADAVQKLSKDPMYWTSFIQSFGNSYDEAIEKGATEDEALLATLLSSTANAIVEVGGGVEQLPGELRKEGLTSAEKIRKWVSSSLDEGKEEVVQGMIERLVNKAVYNQDAPWNDDTGKNEDAVFNFDQSLKEFGMGTAIGGILGGGQMLAQGIAARGQRIVDPTASPFDQAVLDSLQGVQTPENVTQVREPTDLDNIIMAAMNQNAAETAAPNLVEVRPYFSNVDGKRGFVLIQNGELAAPGFFASEGQAQAVANAINTRQARQTAQLNIDNTKDAAYNEINGGVKNGTQLGGTSGEGVRGRPNGDGLSQGAQGRLGENGQGNLSVSGIVLLSPESQRTLTERGIVNVELHDSSADNAAFSSALDGARAADSRNGWAVTPKSVQELQESGARTYMDANGSTGFAVAPDGDIEAVFANKAAGAPKGATKSTIPQAVALGGNKLDCYGADLVKLYARYGFEPVARVAFNPEYANDGWTADKGNPDIYFMMHNGDSADAVVQNMGSYKKWSKAELDTLPVMDYDSAYQYRDWLLSRRGTQTPNQSGSSRGVSTDTNTEERTWHAERRGASPAGTEAAQIEAPGAAPSGFDPLSHASNQYGAIPPGENPTRVVDIPVSMDGETKVSKFSRTAAEAQITTDEMVGRIEQLVQDGKLSHEVYSNKQAIEDGAKQIEKQYARGKSIEQIRSEFIRDANAGKAGAKFVSQGTTLYADAIAEGNYNAASDILVALTAVETNAGQAVQAARLMKSLTPEGRIFTVQKMVSNLEAQINQRRSANKQIEIDVPDALLEAYQNAATTEAQEAALQNIYQNVADQIPTSLGEAAQQWRYFSMLANPSTHAKNIMGNVSGTVAKIGKDNLAALMETIFIGDKEGRTKAFLNPLNKSDQNLLNLGWADYDTAVDLYEDGTGKYSNAAGDINDKRRYWKINDPQNALTRSIDKALNIAEKANNLNSKALEAEDMWFSKPMYSVALAGYMKANGLTEITDAARTYAITEAKRGTYNDLNAVSKWATSLGKGSKLGRFLSNTIYPFKKVPANVMVRTVEYSPLGYLKGAWDLIQMQKGNTDITAAKAIDDFAAATTGTALLGVGAMLAKQGILRATGVGDDKEKEQQKNAFGAKDFSILVGDTYVPIYSLTLIGTGLLMGAQIWEAAQNARNGDEPISFDDFLDALSKITDPIFEQSMLSGMDSILTTIQNSGSAGTGELLTKMGVQILGNYVGQYVPTVIGRVAASLDKNQRSTYLEPDGAWGPVQSAVQGVQKKLPGLRENMAVTYGNWGVPVEGNGANGFGEGVFKAVTPVYPSKQKTDAVEEEIARLHDVNAEYSNFYTKPPKSIAVDGENIKLTSEQYANYTETRGQTDYNLRKNMLDSDIYKILPDNVKSKAMSLSQEYANALGKEAAGVGYETDEKWINDLKGKSDEEVLKAILGKAIDASGGLGEVDAKTVYTGTQYAGLSGAVMDKSLEYAREYESALAKEKLGYPIESGWIAEAKGLSKEDRTDLFIQKAADSVSNTMGGSKLDNLGTMLENGTINDAAVYAALSADDLDRYMEVGKGKLGTDKLLDAMSYYNSDECKSVKDASGEVIDGKRQVDNYVNFLQKTGWTDQEKAAAYLQEYTNLKDMPEQWLSAVDNDMIMGAIGKDDLAKWESLGKDTVSAEKVLQATYKFDTLESDKDANGKSISGSKQRKYIDYLDSTDMSEGEKRTLFLMRYTEKNCPYGTGEGNSASIATPSATTVSSGTTVVTTGNGTSGSGGYSSGGYSGGWSSGKTDEPSQMEKAYTRFGKDAGATEAMYQQAKRAHDGMQTIMDMDGNTVRSVEDQFDGWLSQQDWTQEQKEAVRAGFFTDTVKNLQYLSTQLRAGTMSVAAAKNELSPTIQTGWSQNVLDSGASMADYIDAVATFKQAPNADERKAMGYKNKYTWFCDYLNTTDMTPEQKYAVAICMGDYADSTKKRIMKAVGWDGKTPSAQSASSQSTSGDSGKTQILSGDAFWKELERQLGHALTRNPEGQALKAEIDRRKEEERTYDIRTDNGYREYLNLLLGRTDRYEAKDGSVWTVGEDGDVISRTADGRELKVKAVFDKEDVDDQPEDGYTVSTKPGKLAYQMLQNGVMKAWEAPDGWTWKLVDGEIIAEKKGMKMPIRLAG